MISTLPGRIGLSSLALAAAVTLAPLPAAADDGFRCTREPRSAWKPLEEIAASARGMGYTLRAIEADDGCWEVKGTDRNGARVSLRFHPITGEVVQRGQRGG